MKSRKHLISGILILTFAAWGITKLIPTPLPDLTVAGYVNMADGLGRQGAELLFAFKDELKVGFKQTERVKNAIVPKKLKKLMKSQSDKWGKVVIYEDILWAPNSSNSALKALKHCPSSRIKLAYSMYEATRIPGEWVKILNSTFDAVLVPSPFLINAYRDSGVKIPIFEIPLGLDLSSFISQPLKERKNERFTFGNLSAGTDRKNLATLIKAFRKAFGNNSNVRLCINSRYSENGVRNEITRLLAEYDAPNIFFTQKSLSQKEYLSTFKGIDCYVSPSKGEGFSIQPREAMALGIPVIATDNTGQTPICQTGLVEVVKSPIKQLASNPWGDYYGVNFDCSIDDLARAMLKVYDNYQEHLSNGEQAREWASTYQYSELKSLYKNVIKPKKVVLGDTDKISADCVTTSSSKFFNKLRKVFDCEYENMEILKDITVCNEAAFTKIYQTGEWGRNENGEGFSGMGSTPENARPYISYLENFMKEKNIRSVVDLGCGDWTFSRHINWGDIQYSGFDVVEYIVKQNKQSFSNRNIHFYHADGANYTLPKADLFLCKEVLQHLSNGDVQAIIKQIGKYKYCLLTNDLHDPSTVVGLNEDISSGGLRALDLCKPPFNLKGSKVLRYEAHGNTKETLLIETGSVAE